ncbi:MAG: tetratricopeptide repeat protein [Myxococcota bacterium]|nr:tetratricopeptide repeat protein [Myxococcota bacterium]
MLAPRISGLAGLRGRTGLVLALCVFASAAWAAPGLSVAPEPGTAFAAPPQLEALPAVSAAVLSDALARAVAGDETDIRGSGLPEGPAEDGYRNHLERGWFSGGADLTGRAAAVRVGSLHLGAGGAIGPALALIAPAGEPPELKDALLAVRLSPDLPLAHVALASAYWSEGQHTAAFGAFVDAFRAMPRNLEAGLWLVTSAMLMFVAVAALASLIFIAMAGLSVFPRVAHDVGDLVSRDMPGFARAALLGSLIALPLALGEGLFGVGLVLFATGVAYGSSGQRLALGLAATMLVMSLFPLSALSGRLLSMWTADPVAKSVHAVEAGNAGAGDLELLRSVEVEDGLAAQGLAIHARRTGHDDEAYQRYKAILAEQPRNPVVMTNLANLEFQRGAVDEAIRLYERASAVLDSPVLWFNLSQAYAHSFKMDEFEHALERAQMLGEGIVADLSRQKDPSLIADLPIPLTTLRSRMFQAAEGAAFGSWLRAPLAPGYAARDWQSASLGFGILFVLGTLLASRFDHAGTCGRCGVRICARCDGTVWNSLTCENCHRLFNHPETTAPTLRAARLGELRIREARIERAVLVASLVLPGVGGMFAKRPDLAFLALACFSWSVVAFVWRAGAVPDPLVVGAAGSALFMATAVASSLIYAGLVVSGLSIRRNL